jgi:predicted metal-dependent peptidase
MDTQKQKETKKVDMQAAMLALHEAKFDLISLQPFYAILLQKHSFSWDPRVGTAGVGVNAKGVPVLVVSPAFFLSLPKMERVGLLMHEMLHVVMRHYARGKDLQKKLANISMDIAINQHIPREILPQGALLPEQFKLRPMEAFEFYYVALLQNQEAEKKQPLDNHDFGEPQEGQGDSEGGGSGDSEGQNGDGQDNNDGDSFANDAVTQAAVDQAVAEALKTTRDNFPGRVPVAVEKIFRDRLADKSKTNWKSILKGYIGRNTSSEKETTRNKPNRRLGLMAPGMKRIESPKVLIGIDHSGSVSDSMVAQFEEEIRSILAALSDRTEVAYFDTKIHKTEKLRNCNGRDVTRRASGGTDFSCIMKYAEEVKPDVLVILTDGEASMPKVPRCSLIWCIIGNSPDSHLHGRKIRLKWEEGGFKS